MRTLQAGSSPEAGPKARSRIGKCLDCGAAGPGGAFLVCGGACAWTDAAPPSATTEPNSSIGAPSKLGPATLRDKEDTARGRSAKFTARGAGQFVPAAESGWRIYGATLSE